MILMTVQVPLSWKVSVSVLFIFFQYKHVGTVFIILINILNNGEKFTNVDIYIFITSLILLLKLSYNDLFDLIISP